MCACLCIITGVYLNRYTGFIRTWYDNSNNSTVQFDVSFMDFEIHVMLKKYGKN